MGGGLGARMNRSGWPITAAAAYWVQGVHCCNRCEHLLSAAGDASNPESLPFVPVRSISSQFQSHASYHATCQYGLTFVLLSVDALPAPCAIRLKSDNSEHRISRTVQMVARCLYCDQGDGISCFHSSSPGTCPDPNTTIS